MIEREAVTFVLPVSLRSYDAAQHSRATSTFTGADSLVQQHFKDEVDINTIMRRFGLTRELPLGPASGVYGDFTGISDFSSAMERIEGARERFMALPPEVRERFDNDPGKLIAMASALPAAEFDALFSGNVTAPVEPVVASVTAPVAEPGK